MSITINISIVAPSSPTIVILRYFFCFHSSIAPKLGTYILSLPHPMFLFYPAVMQDRVVYTIHRWLYLKILEKCVTQLLAQTGYPTLRKLYCRVILVAYIQSLACNGTSMMKCIRVHHFNYPGTLLTCFKVSWFSFRGGAPFSYFFF